MMADREVQTSWWTTLKLAVVLCFTGTEAGIRYSDKLRAKGK